MTRFSISLILSVFFLLISDKKYPHFESFLIIFDNKNSHLFLIRSEGLKSAATSRRLGNLTAFAILLFIPAPQNGLLLSDLIMKTISYSRETSSLITHITYTHARS